VAIENLRKHLILALSVFQFAFWLWIYSHPKKKVLGKMSWTHPPARLLAMVRTADMVLRGKQFVSRPPRLPREAPQCTQPLAPNSHLQLHRDSLSRRTEVWWSRARSPIYRHPGAPPPPPPPSCCFHNWRKREHCGCRNLSVRPSVRVSQAPICSPHSSAVQDQPEVQGYSSSTTQLPLPRLLWPDV
jgi:hypothetical protein